MKIGTMEDGTILEIDAKDFLTKKIQMLAKTDSGKTYLASLTCEELLEETLQTKVPLPIVVLTPVSAYWGLKERYPVVIFADKENKHADYPLTDEKGKIDEQAELIADLLATTQISAIIDLDGWIESKQQQFGAAFAKRLYAKNMFPRHVFIEEADVFIPQNITYEDEVNSRHYFDNLVRRGRQRGIGVTVISQRPALISKNVLTQSDLSVYLHLSGAADLAPARKEITDDDDLNKEEKQKIIGRIKKLQRGEAFFYSPRWLGLKKFVTVGKKRTYHAGATKGAADYRPEDDVKLVPVNIEDVQAKLLAISKTTTTKVPLQAVPSAKVDVAKIEMAVRERLTAEYEAKMQKVEEFWKGIVQKHVDKNKTLEQQLADFEVFKKSFAKIFDVSAGASPTISSENVESVVVEEKTHKNVPMDESTTEGRIGLLAARGFFNEGKAAADIHNELLRLYPDTPKNRDHFRYRELPRVMQFWTSRPYEFLFKDSQVWVISEKGRNGFKVKEVVTQ